MSGGGNSNKKQIRKQYEYDLKKHEYDWQEMQDYANLVTNVMPEAL